MRVWTRREGQPNTTADWLREQSPPPLGWDKNRSLMRKRVSKPSTCICNRIWSTVATYDIDVTIAIDLCVHDVEWDKK